jgi:hypothetical protein
MATTQLPPRPSRSGQPAQSNRPSLASVTGKGHGLPNRYGIGAVEKWGKTSLAAQFPGAVFIESKGETGLETLIDAGRLKETPHFPECQDWLSLLGCVDALLGEPHSYQTCVLDTINGAETLCHDYTRDTDCEGSKEKFAAYGRGSELALGHWRELLSKLDRLRIEKKMRVVCLYHMKVKGFKNPMGADYDRYEPEMDQKTWGITKKWLDVILFGNFETVVTNVKENKISGEIKGKSAGGQMRVIYTERTSAYDAGNRLGLPSEIDMGNSPEEAWANFTAAARAAKENSINGK